MRELPKREPRSPEEQFADAQAMQEYFRDPNIQQPIRYIVEGEDLRPVIPGDIDYDKALPARYDRDTGMSILPGDSHYEDAAEKRPKRFR